MANYYRSTFKHAIDADGGLAFPETWYGFDYIPGGAEVLLINGDDGWLIARAESKLPNDSKYMTPLTEAEALAILNDPPASKSPAQVTNFTGWKGVRMKTAIPAKGIKPIADLWAVPFDPYNIMGEGNGR